MGMTHTHGLVGMGFGGYGFWWVWVLVGMGQGWLLDTHGLPMRYTKWESID